jgi:hypothetical protein
MRNDTSILWTTSASNFAPLTKSDPCTIETHKSGVSRQKLASYPSAIRGTAQTPRGPPRDRRQGSRSQMRAWWCDRSRWVPIVLAGIRHEASVSWTAHAETVLPSAAVATTASLPSSPPPCRCGAEPEGLGQGTPRGACQRRWRVRRLLRSGGIVGVMPPRRSTPEGASREWPPPRRGRG